MRCLQTILEENKLILIIHLAKDHSLIHLPYDNDAFNLLYLKYFGTTETIFFSIVVDTRKVIYSLDKVSRV